MKNQILEYLPLIIIILFYEILSSTIKDNELKKNVSKRNGRYIFKVSIIYKIWSVIGLIFSLICTAPLIICTLLKKPMIVKSHIILSFIFGIIIFILSLIVYLYEYRTKIILTDKEIICSNYLNRLIKIRYSDINKIEMSGIYNILKIFNHKNIEIKIKSSFIGYLTLINVLSNNVPIKYNYIFEKLKYNKNIK